jgi:hypothetical protein
LRLLDDDDGMETMIDLTEFALKVTTLNVRLTKK